MQRRAGASISDEPDVAVPSDGEVEQEAQDDGMQRVSARALALAPEPSKPGSSSKAKGKKKAVGTGMLGKKLSFENLDGGSVGDAASVAGGSEAAGPEMDKVKDIMAKLDLMHCIEGKKLGVQEHHATELLRKLPPGQQGVLKAHLKQLKHAKLLSPSQVGHSTTEEILESLLALQHLKMPVPIAVQLVLWQRHVDSLCKRVHGEKSLEALHGLLTVAQPVPGPENAGDSAFDAHCPCMAEMDLEACRKAQLTLQVFIKDLFTPMVLEGPEKHECLLWLATSLGAEVKRQLMWDVDEHYVMVLVKLQTVCKGLEGLLSKDIFHQLQCASEVQSLRTASTLQNDDLVTVFAKTMMSSQCFEQLMSLYQKHTAKIKMHGEKLKEVKRFFTSNEPTLMSCKLDDVVAQIKEVSFLCAELPECSLSGLLEKASTFTWSFWQSCQKMAKHQPETLNLNFLGEMIIEAGIVFSSEKRWMEARETYGDLISAEAGQAALKKFDEACAVVHNSAKDKLAESLTQLVESLKQVQGMHLTDERVKSISKVMEHSSRGLEAVLKEQDHETSDAIMTPLWHIKTLCKQGVDEKLHARMAAGHELVMALRPWKAEQALETKFSKTLELLVARLMRAVATVTRLPAEPTWAGTILASLNSDAGGLLENIKKAWMQEKLQALQEIIAKVEPVVGGAPDGGSWKQGLLSSSTWSQVVEQAGASILKMEEPKQLSNCIPLLQQVTVHGHV